jgi:hypothetical protein
MKDIQTVISVRMRQITIKRKRGEALIRKK